MYHPNINPLEQRLKLTNPPEYNIMAKSGILRQLPRKVRNVAGALLIFSVLAILFSRKIGKLPGLDRDSRLLHPPLSQDLSPFLKTPSSNYPPQSISKPVPSPDGSSRPGCYIDHKLIKSLTTDSVLYSRWDIAVEQTESFQNFSKQLDVPVPAFIPLKLSDEGHQSLGKCTPDVKITAPTPVPIDASHIMFGLATSLERLYDSLDIIAHWAGGTHARIFAAVEYGHHSAIIKRAAELDIDLTLVETDEEVLDRYISLTRILLENRDSASQWGVIIDDDTFFPSMHNLVKRLAVYDTTKPQYVGAMTEDITEILKAGYIAYGGAGIFLSLPLLEEMDRHYDDCIQLTEQHGDKRISQCIFFYTDTKFTWEYGLHQLDFWANDGSGFYESGRSLPLSLHHWKSAEWFPVDILGMTQVSSICGDECQLHRWRISNTDDWFFINGFSIIHHSYPITEADERGMEQTWDPSPWAREEGFAYSLGPLRPKDEEKTTLHLRYAGVEQDGTVRQIYVYDPEDDSPPYVHEVVWRLTKGTG
ncbi:uncharacterized protein N7459_003786 [Penicillium hispanicum]|uniref:uncharacterized protein n=1 Tax=Penicillium hispanicum TaxID=1080232 RepID=UPI002541FC72|nr:uncharacterized protein N7459_003786 [Penicillium hispanicum]KAJ5583986.1 hypothetical protein N7459_003786 [Penicillium hispanicum]